MKKWLSGKRRFLTLLLAIVGIAITVAYMLCLGYCKYLKGDILGIDLKHLGIFYMAMLFILAWFRKHLLCLLLLAFGAGGEIFLIGYQIHSGVYCPYCLGFAVTIFLALAVNFEPNRKAISVLAAAAGLAFFLLFFSGSTTPAFAAEPAVPVFGKGAVEVRIYTDYFCEPCAAEEPEVMALVGELVDKGLIRVVFIDAPVHSETVLYTGYFLAALNAKKELHQAVAARSALFEAAHQEIRAKESIEAFLKDRKVDIVPYDITPIFRILNNYLKEDKIQGTPTCVIVDSKRKQTLTGKEKILNGLREIRK